MFESSSKRIAWIILALCSLVWLRTAIFYIIITPFHHLPLHHFIHFAYYHIHDYSGKISKLVQNYQGSEEALLCEFSKVELMKGVEVFQTP